MGAGGSSDRDYQSVMAELTLEDKADDPKYWTSIIQKAVNRRQFVIPSPRLLSEMADKFPRNLLKLLKCSVDFLDYAANAVAKEQLPQVVFDQLAQVMWTFTMACVATGILPKHRHVYNCILGEEYDPKKVSPLVVKPIGYREISLYPSMTNLFPETIKVPEKMFTTNDANKVKSENPAQTYSSPNDDGEQEQGQEEEQNIENATENVEEQRHEEENHEEEHVQPQQEQQEQQDPVSLSDIAPAHASEVRCTLPEHFVLGETNVFPQKKDSLMGRFIGILLKTLMKENFTLVSGATKWGEVPDESEYMQYMRYDIVHSLLVLMNMPKITSYEIPPVNFTDLIDNFPAQDFVESCFKLSSENLRLFRNSTPNKVLNDLVQNMIDLCLSISIWNKDFLKGFTNARPDFAIACFAGSVELPFTGVLSINPTYPLSSEAVSFLYVTAVNCPQFISYIGAHQMSNVIIGQLLFLSQYMVEAVGLSFMHQIILTIIDTILSDELSKRALNMPFLEQLTCVFRPHRGSYGDVLIEFLLNLRSKDLNSRICTIIKRILPTSNLTVYTCYLLFKYVESVKKNEKLFNLLLEGFAGAVQSYEDDFNLKVFIIQNTQLFKRAANEENEALTIVQKFLTDTKEALGKGKLTVDQAAARLATIKPETIFPTQTKFATESIPIDEKQWTEWIEVLFFNAYKGEIERLKFINVR